MTTQSNVLNLVLIVVGIVLLVVFFICCRKVITYKEPAGDDLDEHDFINQGEPFYYE